MKKTILLIDEEETSGEKVKEVVEGLRNDLKNNFEVRIVEINKRNVIRL